MARPLNLSAKPPREAHSIAFNKYSKIIDIRSMPRGWLRRKMSNIQIWNVTATDSNRNATLHLPFGSSSSWPGVRIDFMPSSLDFESASDFSSDSEWQNFGSAHRLTDFLDIDGLTDIDVSEDEAEDSLECLYWKEEDRISHAEAKSDPNWKPKQKSTKHKVAGKQSEARAPIIQTITTNHKISQSQVQHRSCHCEQIQAISTAPHKVDGWTNEP